MGIPNTLSYKHNSKLLENEAQTKLTTHHTIYRKSPPPPFPPNCFLLTKLMHLGHNKRILKSLKVV